MTIDLAARLDRTVLYQVYPQSYADANGDGIGDLDGIRCRLDYLAWLGVDAIWLNPCFASPFADAGYDVSDYLRIAPRYGTDDDLAALCSEAEERGIAVLLDLVAGHTSDRHPWFVAGSEPGADSAVRDRYIWSDTPRPGFVAGPHGGYYRPNFFDSQPALNFGYARPDPDEPWRQPVDAPGPVANRAALREVMAHWFGLGVAGFRVDMAASLVKDDPGLVETGRLWSDMRAWLDAHFPGRVLAAEWGDPRVSVPAGFHLDFLLQFGGEGDGLALRSLWANGAGTVDEGWTPRAAWADADARGDAAPFVDQWRRAAAAIAAAGHGGVVGFPTANHDFSRLVVGPRDAEQARVPFVLVMTWPALPCVYYGDEIGMRYVPGTPTTEGSRLGPRFERAGSRTPMQWGPLPAATYGPGTPAQSRYLPQDPDPERPTVAAQVDDEGSLLRLVRDLIALRHTDRRLDVAAPVRVLSTTYPMTYLRGETLLVALNPGREPVTFGHPGVGAGTPLVAHRLSTDGDTARLGGFGYAAVDLSTAR
jgi:maltose alpha-D-glucosyltransferase/alpha-amylase